MSYISLACIAAFGCIGLLGSAFGYIRQHRVGLPWTASGSDPESGIRSRGNPDGRDRASIRDPIRDPVHDPIQNPIRDPIRIPIREPIRGPIEGSEIRHPFTASDPASDLGIRAGRERDWAALGCFGGVGIQLEGATLTVLYIP